MKLRTAFLMSAALTAPGGAALAQSAAASAVPEVVVTANKRAERLQAVAASVQAVTGATLDKIGAVTVNDYIDQVPGLVNQGNGITNNSFTVRGLGNVSGSFPTVGYYVDETPLSEVGAPSVDLFDVQRIEILKGPQGTLYGEGSIGGTIKVVTNQPDVRRFSGEVEGSAASINHGAEVLNGSAALNLPLVEDRIAVRAVASYNDNGGFIDNRFTGQKDVNGYGILTARLAAKIVVNDQLTLTPAVLYQSTQTHSDSLNDPTGRDFVFGPGGKLVNDSPNGGNLTLADDAKIPNGTELTISTPFPEYQHDAYYVPSLTLQYNGPGFAVTSSTSYYHRRDDSLTNDRDTLYAIRLGVDAATGGQSVIPLLQGSREMGSASTNTFAEEVRITSTSAGPLAWIVGAYYRTRSLKDHVEEDAPDLLPLIGTQLVFLNDQTEDYRQYAGFGEVSYNFTPALKATFGARVFTERLSASSVSQQILVANAGQLSGSDTTTDTLFKGALQYNFDPDHMVYALYSQGTRPGGVNTRILAGVTPLFYRPDFTTNYEVGLKTQWFDRTLTANLSLFYIDWTDVQLSNTPSAAQCNGSQFCGGFVFTTNGGQARSEGVELELEQRIGAHFDVGLNGAYDDAKVTKGSGQIPTNSVLPASPRWKTSLYGEYFTPIWADLEFRARASFDYVDTRFGGASLIPDVAMRPPLKAYDLINAQVSLAKAGYTAALFVENLSDYRAQLNNPNFTTYNGFNIAQPRTIGVRLSKNF